MKCDGHEIQDNLILCSRINGNRPTGQDLFSDGIKVIIGVKAPGADPAMVCVQTANGRHQVEYVKLEDFRCSGCDILCSALPVNVPQLGYLRAKECHLENKVIVFKD